MVARLLVMASIRVLQWAAIIVVAALFAHPISQAGELTLYGIIDTGISAGHVSRNAQNLSNAVNATTLGMNTGVLVGGSRWGIRGSETLGSGWRTEFVLESGVNSTNGQLEQGGKGFGRQATITLAHSHALQLDLGLQMNLASRYFLSMDPFHGGTSQLALGTSLGNANVIRYANLVQLQLSPVRGLKLGMSYSFDPQLAAVYADTTGALQLVGPTEAGFGLSQKIRVVSAGFQYQTSALLLAGGYDHAFAPSSTVTNLSYAGVRAWLVGARYDAKLAVVSLVLGQSFNGAFDGQLPGVAWSDSPLSSTTPNAAIRFQNGYNSQSAYVGLIVPLRHSWKVSASWQAMQPLGSLAGAATSATQQVLSFGLIHELSRRLTAYFYASSADNYAMVRTARSQVVGMGLAFTF